MSITYTLPENVSRVVWGISSHHEDVACVAEESGTALSQYVRVVLMIFIHKCCFIWGYSGIKLPIRRSHTSDISYTDPR